MYYFFLQNMKRTNQICKPRETTTTPKIQPFNPYTPDTPKERETARRNTKHTTHKSASQSEVHKKMAWAKLV